MEFAKTVFLLIHVASVLGMLVLLLMQTSKSEKVLPKGFMHAALTALVAGFALVGIDSSLNDEIIEYQKETIQTLNQSLDETKKLLDEATKLLNEALLMIES